MTYSKQHFRSKYVDEYTGETLDPTLIAAAIREELNYFNAKVWNIDLKSEAMKTEGAILVRSRWVLCNKGDNRSPDIRARRVACERNKGDKHDAFYALTPPLEAKKFLFSRFAQERTRKGQPMQLGFLDVKKAYFNGIPERDVYMSLPKKLGLPSHLVAKQVRCVYGTRDAGAIWEDTYRDALEGLGFASGVESPCCFWHKHRNISTVVHGDDNTSLALGPDLDWLQEGLSKSFELKIRGRIGKNVPGDNEMRILNRIVTLLPDGILYEADPRHTDILTASLGLTSANSCVTPGVKDAEMDADVVKNNESEDVPMVQPKRSEPMDTAEDKMAANAIMTTPMQYPGGRMQRALSYIRSMTQASNISSTSTLRHSSIGIANKKNVDVSGRLHDKTEFIDIPAYSTVYGVHPSMIIATVNGFKFLSNRAEE